MGLGVISGPEGVVLAQPHYRFVPVVGGSSSGVVKDWILKWRNREALVKFSAGCEWWGEKDQRTLFELFS